MLFYGLQRQDQPIFVVLVLVMKFGISSCFNITYVAHKSSFPTLFSTSSLGFCTFLCRFFTAFTPMMAIMDHNFSVSLFAITTILGSVIVLGVRKINDEDYKYEPEAKKVKQA